MECPRCQHKNPADAVFCQECGTRLETACPGCGTANQLGAKFCKKCGRPVAMTPPAAMAGKFSSPRSCACGSSGAAVCGAGGVMTWERGRGEGARGRGGR
jgi:hypothetical protein